MAAALRMLAAQIGARARVTKTLHAVPPVHATRAQLLQVFVNLLMNAVQALRRDEPGEIHVGTFRSDLDEVVVEVGDNGCGIPPDNFGTIFQPFFTTKPPGQGTGLGLSVCHQILSSLGGRITVDSAIGTGSTFRVYLPTEASRANGLHRINSTTPTHGASKLRILVVEDDTVVANTVKMVLATHDIILESEIQAARERVLAGEHFDAVVCDLNLPDGTGAELHIAIAQYRPELEDRFLLMTGGARRRADAEFVRQLGARAILKPFEAQALEDAIREVTKQPSAKHES